MNKSRQCQSISNDCEPADPLLSISEEILNQSTVLELPKRPKRAKSIGGILKKCSKSSNLTVALSKSLLRTQEEDTLLILPPEEISGFTQIKPAQTQREKLIGGLRQAISDKKTIHIEEKQVFDKAVSELAGSTTVEEGKDKPRYEERSFKKKKKRKNRFIDDMAEADSESSSGNDSDGSEVEGLIDDTEIDLNRHEVTNKFFQDFICQHSLKRKRSESRSPVIKNKSMRYKKTVVRNDPVKENARKSEGLSEEESDSAVKKKWEFQKFRNAPTVFSISDRSSHYLNMVKKPEVTIGNRSLLRNKPVNLHNK